LGARLAIVTGWWTRSCWRGTNVGHRKSDPESLGWLRVAKRSPVDTPKSCIRAVPKLIARLTVKTDCPFVQVIAKAERPFGLDDRQPRLHRLGQQHDFGEGAVPRSLKAVLRRFARLSQCVRTRIVCWRRSCDHRPVGLRGQSLGWTCAVGTAKVEDDLIAEWRVYEDTAANRALLGIAE
jgi:hypothetical protein